jgi:signal transduction histidine kinase
MTAPKRIFAAVTATQRLDLLLEISRSLMQFDTVDEVVPTILGHIGKALPLRTAVLIGEVGDQSVLRAWRAVDVTTAQLNAAVEHGKASYQAYFGDEAAFARRLLDARATVSARVLPRRRAGESGVTDDENRFIMLPLVLGPHRVFGALQIERAERMDEEQLAFLNTVVNLLAIAVDRHVTSRREVVARERAQTLEGATAELLKREEAALVTAQAAIRSRDLFLAIVSHDLRNLTGAADIAAHMLLKFPPEDAKQHERLKTVKRATTQMGALLRDLIDTASIEDGRLSVVREVCSVRAMVTDTAEIFRSLAESKSVELILDVPPDPPAVWADPRRIEQALGNLVKNAIRFSPPNKPVTIGASLIDGTLRLSVRDEGLGVPPEHHESIFERYWTEGPESAGVGLGLFIVKAIVDGHGGSIGVVSQPGHGSTFWFTIPPRVDAGANAGPRS